MNETMTTAGFFTSHAIQLLGEGRALPPMVGLSTGGKRQLAFLDEQVDSEQELMLIIDGNLAKTDPESAAILVDAYAYLDAGKSDALVVEIRHRRPPIARLKLIIAYEQGAEGFTVSRPLIEDHQGLDPEASDELMAAFFEGVAQHPKGLAIWEAATQ